MRQQVLLQRVTAYADQGDTANALRTLEDARNIDKTRPKSGRPKSLCACATASTRRPLAAADMAIAGPDSSRGALSKATIAHSRADAATTLAGYAKALSLDPNH